MRPTAVGLLLLLTLLPAAADAGRKGKAPDVSTAPIERLADHPGRLRNAAQQALYSRDLPEATRIMARILAAEPIDGFTQGLLAQTLAAGWNLGSEAAAAWLSLSDQAPARAELVAFAALAAREAHRSDRFLGPESPWFAANLARIEAAKAGATPAAKYELLLAQRSLLSLVKQHDAARQAGIEAFALRPEGLQGRLSAMIQARRDGDLAGARDHCLAILATEPWAAEACSTVWAAVFPDDPVAQEAATAAQAAILSGIEVLEARWLRDPVVANELIKFRARIKDHEGQGAYRSRVEAANPGFRYLNRSQWWRAGTVIAPPYRSLNVAATKSRELPAAERLAALMTHWESVPAAGDSDWGLTRYLKAVAEAAAESGDRVQQGRALQALSLGQPDDPDALLALAEYHAVEPNGAAEALRLVRLSAERLLDQPWDAMAAARRRERFSDHVTDLRQGLALRLELEARLGESSIDPERLPANAAAWLTWADAAGDPIAALHGSLEGLSLLSRDDREALTDDILASSVERFSAAVPAIGALGLDVRAALLAAVDARAQDRERRVETGGKEQHPLVGQPAPAFALSTLAGASLTNKNQHGRVVVVDFWATWCGPCIQEMPHLQEVLERLGDAPVTFLAASVDGTEDPVRPFLSERGFGFDAAWVGEVGMKQRWQVRGIPSLFVLDRSGRVRHHHQGYRKDIGPVLEAEIRTLLAEP